MLRKGLGEPRRSSRSGFGLQALARARRFSSRPALRPEHWRSQRVRRSALNCGSKDHLCPPRCQGAVRATSGSLRCSLWAWDRSCPEGLRRCDTPKPKTQKHTKPKHRKPQKPKNSKAQKLNNPQYRPRPQLSKKKQGGPAAVEAQTTCSRASSLS